MLDGGCDYKRYACISLDKRAMECKCSNAMDRDLNAAMNVLAVGKTVTVHEDGVRLVSFSGATGGCL